MALIEFLGSEFKPDKSVKKSKRDKAAGKQAPEQEKDRKKE